ncbi:MchC protein, partial [Salmonella enterica subsp. enterica]|nr:MchC protein [Salmonella enterica subsp. enterica]
MHAIYEALWGEVLAQILPYGAVRARAVLLTDIYTDKAFDRPHGKSRRALLVREPVIRPAHFERAPYFRPQPEYVTQLVHDARRVRSVIHMLPGNLPVPPEGVSEEAQRDHRVYCIEGLCELARREAWQMAFCRTRFLRLTTSPSNIAIDGRLMDFNGLSCL